MRTDSRGVGGAVLALLLLVLTACGAAEGPPGASDSTGSGGSAGPSATVRPAPPSVSGSVSAGRGAPRRFATSEDLSAAVVAAVRAKGSVLITTTAQGTPMVSRRSVQVAVDGQNTEAEVSIPGQTDQSLVIVDDVPYLSVSDDSAGHWMRTRFDDLASSKVWASAVYAVDLITELSSWGLAVTLTGGDAGTLAGEDVRTYTLTLGPQAAAAQVRLDRVAPADRPGVADRLSRMQYDVTVTLGPDDLPRTVTTLAPVSGLLTTQTYSRWGAVAVDAPGATDLVQP